MDKRFYTISPDMMGEPLKHEYPGFILYHQGDGGPYIGTAESLKEACCIESTWVHLHDLTLEYPTALFDQSILMYLVNGER